MKVLLVLLGTLCLFLETRAQGFFPPNIDQPPPLPHNIYQRQLTASQQNHILSDIQQHQHRFSINQPNHRQHQQFTFQQHPSLELNFNQQQQQQHDGFQQRQFPNQRLPPPPSNPIRFPTPNNQPVIQHHTQTNFIPNFSQQGSNQAPHNTQFQRSPDNQFQILQQPFQPQQQANQQQQLQQQHLQQQQQHFHQQQQQQQQQVPNLDFHRQNFFALQNSQPPPIPTPQFQPIPPSFQQIPVVDGRVVVNQPPVTTISYQNPPAGIEPFQPVPVNFNPAPQITGSSIIQPNSAKDQIIQKHEAFVQKQYEKQQQKVKQLHQEFQQKQHSIKQLAPTVSPQQLITPAPPQQGRQILPNEAQLFQHALRQHELAHPRPTTSTTTTETVLSTEDPYEKLLQAQRKDIYAQLKLESATSRPSSSAPQAKQIDQNQLLQQLSKALASSPQSSLGDKKFDASEIVLPNGQKVQVIRTSDPNLIAGGKPLNAEIANVLQSSSEKAGATAVSKSSVGLKVIAPSSPQELVLPTGGKVQIIPSTGGQSGGAPDLTSLGDFGQNLASEARIVSNGEGPPSLEELAAKGLIPEGYEIVQQPAPGSRPTAAAAPKATAPPPPKKKPTFVYLEEQADGSFKIQGIKANGEKDPKTSGSELDNILERIQKGEIQLPPSVTRVKLPDGNELVLKSDGSRVVEASTTTQAPITTTTIRVPQTSTTIRPRYTRPPRPARPSSPSSSTTPRYTSFSTSTERFAAQSTSHVSSSVRPEPTTTPVITSTQGPTERIVNHEPDAGNELTKILKDQGLYAMAKYLKQSGLDNILNETGPYTVFVPTDKAFKNLLVQLGGPERAEEKFKANPRLLSGLLLHHVIPGSFEVSTLQDEMTGVSLAGTQLRVNQYNMHDQEWNDVQITTINGAMVVNEKQDIKIPQGIAHGVDRVMFPLPVGDLLQTLQSDRERRFTTFLKILYTSGMSELLQNKGPKTYTVFAPTDNAFAEYDQNELAKLTSDKDAAQAFAMKYIMPGTLFSAGMRFYQVKDSLLPGNTITLQKTSNGKIKVNEAQMITSNIPSTNGVIHAIDGPI